MAEENKKGGVDNTEETQPDAFGMVDDQNTPPAGGGEGEGEKDKGGKEKGGEKKFEAIPEDHPTIVSLKNEIEKVKSEYGGNLSSQRDIIKTLEGKIDALTKGDGKGGKGEGADDEVLYKNIKWSKDLTKEEREEMTDTEIKQMDEIAEMKEAQNKIYADQRKKDREAEEKAKGNETKEVENLNALVQTTAKTLATGEDGKVNTELANQIIEATKQFNLTGLTEEQVKERVTNATKLVPDYKAPKEQTNKRGGALDGNGKAGDDPFGVDKIVEEASKGGDGSYSL